MQTFRNHPLLFGSCHERGFIVERFMLRLFRERSRHNSCSVGENTIRKSRQSIENIVRIGVVVGQCPVDFRPAEDFAQIEKGLLGGNVASRF